MYIFISVSYVNNYYFPKIFIVILTLFPIQFNNINFFLNIRWVLSIMNLVIH